MVSSLEKSLGQANTAWEWLKRPHTLLWSFLAFCVCWAFTTGPTAALATLALWSLASLTRFALWRRHWLGELASAGQPPPGVWKLRKQIKVAQRRKNLILSRWDLACINQEKLQGKRRGVKDKKVPPLTQMRLRVDTNVEAMVDLGAIGKTVEDLMSVKIAIANVCKANDMMVYQESPGVARVTFIYTDPLHTTLQFEELSLPEPRRTPQWVVGIDERGRPLQLPILRPVLGVGEQGSGKSVAAEDLIGSAIHQGIHVLIFGIDGKHGQEWSRMKPMAESGEWHGFLKIQEFADTVEDGKKVITHFRQFMEQRATRFAQEGIREFLGPYTRERPLVILAIDELLEFSEEFKKDTSDFKRALRTIRAGGGTCIGLVQYSHAESLGTARKLFGSRLVFRCESDTAKTALGSDAVARGANAHLISIDTPGIGYFQTQEGYITRFRAAHATDEVVDCIFEGRVPENMGLGRMGELQYTHWVYIIPNRLGECIYLGETGRDPDERLKEHLVKPWGSEIDVRNVRRIPVHGPTPAAALEKALKLEEKLTKELKPLYPSEHNMDNPHRLDWRRGELASERPALKAGSGATVVQLDDHRPTQPTLVEVEPEDGDAELEVNSGNGWGLKRPW
jgi:hypothetical protein